jgi:Fic family protein
MGQLFDYVRASRDIPRAIIASVCHYEIEFIHPFSDGNGRMGRLWQHVILVEGNPLLAQVPFESIIKERQKDYYKALRQSDQAGESTPFVEFSLEALLGALEAIWETYKPAVQRPEDRLQVALRQFGKRWFVRKEYLTCHKGISTATASRDLAAGVEKGLLLVEGEKATARYRFQ